MDYREATEEEGATVNGMAAGIIAITQPIGNFDIAIAAIEVALLKMVVAIIAKEHQQTVVTSMADRVLANLDWADEYFPQQAGEPSPANDTDPAKPFSIIDGGKE